MADAYSKCVSLVVFDMSKKKMIEEQLMGSLHVPPVCLDIQLCGTVCVMIANGASAGTLWSPDDRLDIHIDLHRLFIDVSSLMHFLQRFGTAHRSNYLGGIYAIKTNWKYTLEWKNKSIMFRNTNHVQVFSKLKSCRYSFPVGKLLFFFIYFLPLSKAWAL